MSVHLQPTIALTRSISENGLFLLIKKEDAEKALFEQFRKTVTNKEFEYRDNAALLKEFSVTKETALIIAIKKHVVGDDDGTNEITLSPGDAGYVEGGDNVRRRSPGHDVGDTLQIVHKIALDVLGPVRFDPESKKLAEELKKNVDDLGKEVVEGMQPEIIGAESFLLKLQEQEAKDNTPVGTLPPPPARAAPLLPLAATSKTPALPPKPVRSTSVPVAEAPQKTAAAVASATPAIAAPPVANTAAASSSGSTDFLTTIILDIKEHTNTFALTIETEKLSEGDRKKLRDALTESGLYILDATPTRQVELNMGEGFVIQPDNQDYNFHSTYQLVQKVITENFGKRAKVENNALRTITALIKGAAASLGGISLAETNPSFEEIDKLQEDLQRDAAPASPSSSSSSSARTSPTLGAAVAAGPGSAPASPKRETTTTVPAENTQPPTLPSEPADSNDGGVVPDPVVKKSYLQKFCDVISFPFVWFWGALKSLWRAIFGHADVSTPGR